MKDRDFETASMDVETPKNVTEYDLKTLPVYFDKIWNLLKKFELRKNDRGFKLGDVLNLREYNPTIENCEYTGRSIRVLVTFILENCPEFGLQEGFCIMGFQVIEKTET